MIVGRKKIWLGAAASLVAVASLTAGVLRPDRISPGEARSRASHTDARPAAGTTAYGGAVDCGELRCIALTFDAGPGKDTPELLDLLKKEQVPATFFLLGEDHVLKHPKTVRRMATEGHELANHTWSHRILTDLDAEGIRTELARTQDAIERVTGRKPTLMRPPQGRTDREVVRVSRELGLAQVLWSATAKDYSTTDSALITRRILDAADRDGIILLHDIYDGTVPAVPGIIAELKRRGYTFVTVPQLLAPGVAEPGAVYKP
ncbi:polysaccharide deacetylase family protein [Streptomyces platensis]|uniref:polysaccharide deacetylase family protein n=1 Tax=Streptomyces platensis TaxID=58346 RepID=UPI002E0F491F|nr:polysaccharide deacetylase family protein [Streptomyces platensis]